MTIPRLNDEGRSLESAHLAIDEPEEAASAKLEGRPPVEQGTSSGSCRAATSSAGTGR